MNKAIIVDALHPVTAELNAQRAKKGKSQLNVDYVTMELSTDPITNPNAGGNGASGAVSQLLRGGFEKKRTKVFQSIHKDTLMEAKVKVGSDLNECFETPFGIAVIELTDEEYNALDKDAQKGFSKKINPATEVELTIDGSSIWRKVVLGDAGIESKFVSHDRVKAAAETPATEALKA